jgi:GR25 family glycosyltransferase involved in LPS biosynthesis
MESKEENLNHNLNLEKLLIEYKKNIQVGADAKIIQYDSWAEDICHDKIDLPKILNDIHFSNLNFNNCIMINIVKDKTRYHSTLTELEKISITNFVHLKATYWKEKDNMLQDLKMILSFLSNFNSEINQNTIDNLSINEFSDLNDANIKIQDGPLACYISHLRAMMYGYLNFKDYTIVVEDDISITNTSKIETYLKEIPNDWDIICMNSVPLHMFSDKPYYKYENIFHSTHFYIVKNSIMPVLFKNMYPVVDQVDILIAKLYNSINIYNIRDTVYQKNFSTNTQNNLNTIFKGPNYQPIRNSMLLTRIDIQNYVDDVLKDNLENRNNIIASTIYSDIIYNHIHNFKYQSSDYVSEKGLDVNRLKYENEYTHVNDENFINKNKFFKSIYNNLYHVINCVIKGKNIHNETYDLTERICRLIESFNLHNKYDQESNEIMKAFSYGSSSNVYLLEKSQVIIKVYNNYLRWTCDDHDNINDIFEREIESLRKRSLLLSVDKDNLVIRMKYLGESLYNDFKLPNDWKIQLKNHFDDMDLKGIMYPEFNLKNILVLNDKINLIDYGLCNVNNLNRNENYFTFVELIEKINNKYDELDKSGTNNLFYGDENMLLNLLEMKKIYYNTLILNSKIDQKYIGNIF